MAVYNSRDNKLAYFKDNKQTQDNQVSSLSPPLLLSCSSNTPLLLLPLLLCC